jgi:6-pyruvoyltetrahydropterin/6-carboxytetrahydropterin synthase
MPEIVVFREVHFNAAHRLHNPARSDEWNRETFGVCNSPNFHGHNYVLQVGVRGSPDPETGFVIELGLLKRILEEQVVHPLDHKNLNLDVPFLEGVLPSTENLVTTLWDRIAPRIPSGSLHVIRLIETPRNWAEYYGPTPAKSL